MRKSLGKKNTTKDVKAINALAKYSGVIIACRVYNDADFTHNSTGNYLAITFNSDRRDARDMHSTTSNTSRITIPVSGWYLITGECVFAANATGVRSVGIRVGGSTFIVTSMQLSASGSIASSIQVATLYYLSATNYIELMAYQDSGGNLNIVSSANYSPEFAVVRIPFNDTVVGIG